jgi:hypothetical protein
MKKNIFPKPHDTTIIKSIARSVLQKGDVIWHQFEFIQFVLWRHFRIYFGTAMYVENIK